MTTICELVGLHPVTARTTAYPSKEAMSVVDPQLIFGVELEIENVPDWEDLVIRGMTSTEDGSLRNNGREFLMHPQKYQDAVATLTKFFEVGKYTEKNYSERCSIHIHTNCQDLTLEQLQTILFIYQIVERPLFNWVSPARANNIFCVPWHETNLTHTMFDDVPDLEKYRRWMKYTALNLLPLTSLGTIEWRHMPGHSDTIRLFRWMRIISCFFRYARNNKLEDVKEFFISLNTTSQYTRFVDSVFQEESSFIYETPTWQQDLEEGVLLMKYALSDRIVLKEAKRPTKLRAPNRVLGANEAPQLQIHIPPAIARNPDRINEVLNNYFAQRAAIHIDYPGPQDAQMPVEGER